MDSRITRLTNSYPTPTQLLLQPRVMFRQSTQFEFGHGLLVGSSSSSAAATYAAGGTGEARRRAVGEGHGG